MTRDFTDATARRICPECDGEGVSYPNGRRVRCPRCRGGVAAKPKPTRFTRRPQRAWGGS